jgi:hypothetical protein
MRKKYVYCVRLVSTPVNRRFIVQRSDGRFWGGTAKWVVEQHKALVYRTVADAQADCRAFVARQTRGQPRRQFTCTLVVIDYECEADGPLADRYVEVAVRLGDMKEG